MTGHRSDRLSPEATASVRIAVADLLTRLARERARIAAGPGGICLHSMLATGADTAAAEAALAVGAELRAILPFARERYAEDFVGPGEREALFSLLGRATEVVVPVEDLLGIDAYEWGGHRLVDASRLLIAVWDGGPGRGRGGTAAVVEYALSRRVPVIVVPPDRPGEVALLRPQRFGNGGVGRDAASRERVPALPELPALMLEVLGAQAGRGDHA